MYRLVILCLLQILVVPALSAEEITVRQLQQRLATAARSSDKKLEKQLANLQLIERLDGRLLAKLNNSLPGERSRNVLAAIADASAFLPPPQSETITEPPPDRKKQGDMLIQTVRFVGEESKRMPNFLAQRVTTRFQDMVLYPYSTRIQYYTPRNYHYFDRRAANLRYVDGQEEEVKSATPAHTSKQERDITLLPKGLTTWGAFGPLLETVV
ncbi:MAG TPA: hypothetical protein VGJ21_11405, partial [Terracidiphilus sp.]